LNIDKRTVTVAYHENSVYCAITKDFQFGDPFTDEDISMETLMEEMKPIAVKK